jgi:hypothetical protein
MGANNSISAEELAPAPRVLGESKALEALKAALDEGSRLLTPGTTEYETARKYNGWQLDPATLGRPAAIVSVKSIDDVKAVLKYANEVGDIKVSVSCGRHSTGSVLQDGLLYETLGLFISAV